ncbi:MAG TPA: hypothetical protein VI456_07420 [Polyangia bacterium]
MAKPAPRGPAPIVTRAGSTMPAASSENDGADAEALATREQKAHGLQDFRGGGVYIYVGSGVLLVVIVILLILLV